MLKRKKLIEPIFQNASHGIQDENIHNQLKRAKEELAILNNEKKKRATELVIANKELAFQGKQKGKRAAELVVANKELVFQNKEKEKRAAELMLINSELKKAEETQKEYILGLEEMIFITSHKVRQPITQIQGVSNLLHSSINTQKELMEIIDCIKDSIQALDTFTRELTTYIYELQKKINASND